MALSDKQTKRYKTKKASKSGRFVAKKPTAVSGIPAGGSAYGYVDAATIHAYRQDTIETVMECGAPSAETLGNAKWRVICTDARTLIQEIKRGFDFSLLEAIADAIKIPVDELKAPLGIGTARTLARRKQDGRLKTDESERLLRIIKIYWRALSVFKGKEASARIWINRPALGLGGEIPLKHAETEVGANEVLNLLWGMEHGDVI